MAGERSAQLNPDSKPKLALQSVPVAASGSQERQHAFLVYADDALVAVLAQPAQSVAQVSGRVWVLQVGFGPCSGSGPKAWHDLNEFHQWVMDRYHGAETVFESDRKPPNT
jgi:hypothetical protein